MVLPERNVKDCLIVIICICMRLFGFQSNFINIFFFTVMPERVRARIPRLSF